MENIISVYENYVVHYTCDYSYLDEEGDFAYDKVDKEFTYSGSSLLSLISGLLSDRHCISFRFRCGSLYVEHFNVDNGIFADYVLEYEVYKSEEFKKHKNGSC